MQNPTPIREYKPSPAAMQAVRVATAALFVAIGVALSPFNVPIFGAKAFSVQSSLNVLGAVFLGPVYTVLAALVISLIRMQQGWALHLPTPAA